MQLHRCGLCSLLIPKASACLITAGEVLQQDFSDVVATARDRQTYGRTFWVWVTGSVVITIHVQIIRRVGRGVRLELFEVASEHVCLTSVNGIARNVGLQPLAAFYQRYTCELWGVWDTFFILSSLKSHQDPKRGESMELWISVCARVPGCFQSLGCAFRSSARGRASVFELLAAARWVCDFNFFHGWCCYCLRSHQCQCCRGSSLAALYR